VKPSDVTWNVAGDALEGRPADEIAGLRELHDPAEIGLEGVGRPIEFVAIERHAGLVGLPSSFQLLSLG
jgi:hypothetical protein